MIVMSGQQIEATRKKQRVRDEERLSKREKTRLDEEMWGKRIVLIAAVVT